MAETMNSNNEAGERWPLLNKTEESLYEMAYTEVRSESRHQGLWAKALSESLGDEQKSEALYIRLRTEQLTQEQTVQQLQLDETKRKNFENERGDKVDFNCPHCGKARHVTKGQILSNITGCIPSWRFHCPDCKHIFDIRTVVPETITDNILQLLPPSTANNTTYSKTPIADVIRKTTSTASAKTSVYIVAVIACAAELVVFAVVLASIGLSDTFSSGGFFSYFLTAALIVAMVATWRTIVNSK